MCEADLYRVFTGDWRGETFREELGRYLIKRTRYNIRDIEAYLDAEDSLDLIDLFTVEKDITVTIAERAGISVFMVMILVEAREKFIEDLTRSYHVYEDMMYA